MMNEFDLFLQMNCKTNMFLTQVTSETKYRISQKQTKKHDYTEMQIKKENSACGFCRWNCWCFRFHVTTDTTFARAIFSLKSVSKKCCQLSWAAGEVMALKLSVSCSVSFPLGLLGICRTPLTTSVHPIKSAVKKYNSAWYCLFHKRLFTPWSFNLSMEIWGKFWLTSL